MAGSKSAINKLSADLHQTFCENKYDASVVPTEKVDPAAIASVLKRFCRSMPESLFPATRYTELLQIASAYASDEDEKERVDKLKYQICNSKKEKKLFF